MYRLDEGFATIHEQGRFRGEAKDPADKSKRVYFRWDPPALPAWALPPRLNAKEREHAAMVAWIQQHGPQAPEPLQNEIRAAWNEIKSKYATARAFADRITDATGERFTYSPV